MNRISRSASKQVSIPASRPRLPLVFLLSGLAAILAPLHSASADESSPVVYVEGNDPSNNSVLAYHLNRHGELEQIEGSPFSTHGKGVFDASLKLGPFDSDQILTTNAERTLLYAVNPGSNTVAAFHIHADGSLEDVAGSPFPSGGTNPVSVGVSGDTLVVVNKAMDPAQPGSLVPNYVTFRIGEDGALLPKPLSSVQSPVGSSPSQALVSPDKRLVFGSDFLGGKLQSFVLTPGGRLEQNAPQAPSAAAYGTSPAPRLGLGLAANPRRPVVYVGLVTISKIAVYEYDEEGVLHFVRAIADSGAGVCWLRSNATGTRLYASNTGDASITVYDTSDALNPVELQRYPLLGGGNGFQLELDPTNTHLFSVTQRASATTAPGTGNNLHVLDIDANGLLSQSAQTQALPVSALVRPQGLATR